MDYGRIWFAIVLMALVSYLPRVIPLAVFRKKIENRFIQSLLLYMPYGILAAMVFPAVLYSTDNLLSALCGFIVALAMSYFSCGLLPVALGASAAVFLAEWLPSHVIKIFEMKTARNFSLQSFLASAH